MKTRQDHAADCVCCREGREGFLAKLEENIQRCGHSVIATVAEYKGRTVSAAYTVGLSSKNLPEVIVFGVPQVVAMQFLNDVAHRLRNGGVPLDTPIEEIATLPTLFRKVPDHITSEHLPQACAYARRSVRAIQMFWPDRAGIFPWETGFDRTMVAKQPILGEPSH